MEGDAYQLFSPLHDSCFMIRGYFNKEGGFTLIETVVALAVIVAAVVGPVTLITRGLFALSFPRNKIIAANLAQEGLEAIQLIRENNIACNDNLSGGGTWAWNHDPNGGLLGGTYGVDIQIFRSLAGAPAACASIQSPKLSVSCSGPLLFDASAGTYGYQSGDPTLFSRCVQVTFPINAENPGSGMPPIPAADQMDVVSTVTWTERGAPRSISIQKRLYNWHF